MGISLECDICLARRDTSRYADTNRVAVPAVQAVRRGFCYDSSDKISILH